MEPFARIPGRSDDFEDAEQRQAIDRAVVTPFDRRRANRKANLGPFTGYRIGLDIGNGNIGWSVLFEQGHRLHFLTAEDIKALNAQAPKSAKRTQLPDLDSFVPLGTHKFEARERGDKGEKSLQKVRAEAKTSRRMLDARQRRRLHVRKALQDAGLYPRDDEAMGGHVRIKSDDLRVRLLDPSFPAHPHDLGRALYNAMKRRGLMKPIGRKGEDEGSTFAKREEEKYRDALTRFDCRTVGEFLDRCARDARRDGVRFRRRHRTLTWQKQNAKRRPRDAADAKSYEVFEFLSPTFGLIREECNLLRESHPELAIPEEQWARIEEAAEFRRSLKAKIPGRCEYFRDRYRCVRALPSFQRLRVLEQVSNLRDDRGRPLDDATFGTAVGILQNNPEGLLNEHGRIALVALSRELGVTRLKLDRDDRQGARTLISATTDISLTETFGEAWSRLPIEARDDWTMRFLRRHWPPQPGDDFVAWARSDEERLEREAAAAFGPGALAKVDEKVAGKLDDRFSSMSVEAARLRADCYAKRLSFEEMERRLREAGRAEPVLELYERLPYYGAVMPDLVVPADGFAPADRTVREELEHGRAANPDVHVVMNRLRHVVNAIIEMMGGILPTRCVIEMARSALSEDQANAYSRTARQREQLRTRIVAEIEKASSGRTPTGPALERLVDRWKAAIRQGWRDYDGSLIPRSALVDGSEYQLDHVMPAAFGDYRENNMFVSRFNQKKGRQLPWKAFGDDPAFRPALVAFAKFGLKQQIAGLEYALGPDRRIPKKRKEMLEKRLAQVRQKLEALEKEESPRPDVLSALERTLKADIDSLVAGDVDSAADTRPKEKARPFQPGDQAALFRRFIWKDRPDESEPAARDLANIGWNTKLALRYLRHLGAETEAIKAWGPYALRCMFDIDKHRADLRNHAVDAFLVAHFDRRVLRPAFDRLRRQLPYEALYEARSLRWALDRVSGGGELFDDFTNNRDRLDGVLPFIGTAHRPDNRWNPGDRAGGSFAALGGENIYSFRPTLKEREALTERLRGLGLPVPEGHILARKELLKLLLEEAGDEKTRKLRDGLAKHKDAKLRYWSRDQANPKKTPMKFDTALPLTGQPGAFINARSKFAIIGGSAAAKRRIVTVAEFSKMPEEEREALFADGRAVYRRGDTVVKDGRAIAVVGLEAAGQLKCFPIDSAIQEEDKRIRPTVPNDSRPPPLSRFASDVLGRRLHRLRKSSGGVKPVPYPLRGE